LYLNINFYIKNNLQFIFVTQSYKDLLYNLASDQLSLT